MRIFVPFGILGIVLSIVAVIGWIYNALFVLHHINDTVTGVFLLRAIGIVVFPLGCLMGLFA